MLKKLFSLVAIVIAFRVSLFAQSSPPHDWFHLDPTIDKYNGVSDDRAYNELLKNKQSQTVIVAVIDGGTDANHEDLKDHIWTNTKEIAGNGIDDDHNGYVDDIHGWDFIGGKDGDVHWDNFELTRLYKVLKPKYENMDESAVPASQADEYAQYKKLKDDFENESSQSNFNYSMYGGIMDKINIALKEIGNNNPTEADINAWTPSVDSMQQTKQILLAIIGQGVSVQDAMSDLQEGVEQVEADVKYHYNLDYDPRNIVGDNYADGSQRNYGNADVKGPDALHGSHVAGIIGAVRDNSIGINGIAANVKIMVVRVVPDGDERDKDVANGIRYAVDNGAKVINMSFGKGYSYKKSLVDDALKYAASKDVLLVHAAGNDSKDLDGADNFPNPTYEDGSGTASNWITVGASSYDHSVADFSNFGVKSVDLFAPGTEIYSTVSDNQYKIEQGTSMASPVVAGVAALIRSYYPQLTAPQVKQVLMNSVTKVKGKVNLPGTDKKTSFKKLCVSGGIVNAYKAVLEADKMTAQ